MVANDLMLLTAGELQEAVEDGTLMGVSDGKNKQQDN